MTDCPSPWALIVVSLLLSIVLVALVFSNLYWWRRNSKRYGAGMQLDLDLEGGNTDKNVGAFGRPAAPPTSPGCPRGDDLASASAVPARSSRRSGRIIPKPALTASALMGSPKASGSRQSPNGSFKGFFGRDRQSSSMDEIDSMLQAAESEAVGSSNGDVAAPEEHLTKGAVKREANLEVEKKRPIQSNVSEEKWDSEEEWDLGHDARAEARRISTERVRPTAFTASEAATAVDDSVSQRVLEAVSRKPRTQSIAMSADASQDTSSFPRRASLRRSRENVPGRQPEGPSLVERAKAQHSRRRSQDKLLDGATDKQAAPRIRPRQAPNRDEPTIAQRDISLIDKPADLEAAPRALPQRRQAPTREGHTLLQREISLTDGPVGLEAAPRVAAQRPVAQRKSVRIQSSEEEQSGRSELAPFGKSGDLEAMLNGMPGASTRHMGESKPVAKRKSVRIQSSGEEQPGRSELSPFGRSSDLQAMLNGMPGASPKRMGESKPMAAELREFESSLGATPPRQLEESARRTSARAFADAAADMDEEDPLAAALEARQRIQSLLQGASGNMHMSMSSKGENDSAVSQQSPPRLGSSSNSLPPPARRRARLAAEEASNQAQEGAEDAWRRSFASKSEAQLESDRSLPPKGLNEITDIVNMSSFSTPSDLREARKQRRNSNTSNTSISNRASGGRPLDHKAKNLQLDSSSNEVEPETDRPGRSRQQSQSNFNSQRSAEMMPADDNNEWSQVVRKSQGGDVQWY